MRTDAVFGFAALYRAWRSCRRGKRGTRQAQRYETRLLDRLVDTAQALREQHWRPSRAIRFVVTHPKPREVLAADYRDRVVHHLVVPWFERHFEPVFIHDSYANRKGKGSHAAVARLQHFLRAASAAQGERAQAGRGPHYLQLDIANFFNRVDRRTLFGLLRARLERDARRAPDDARHAAAEEVKAMLWLARVLLTGNPAHTAEFQGRPADLARVPAHKQLVHAPDGVGLPIGNLTSQFFANVYLNELDQFVKHQLKARHYLRYVDDFVLVHPERETLERWRDAIEQFLSERLGLSLRDAGRLRPVSDGVDFLGYIVRPHYRLVRRRVLGHLDARLTREVRTLRGAPLELVAPPAAVAALQATLASYPGHCRHAQAGGALAHIALRHRWLAHLFETADAPLSGRRADRARDANSLAAQWRYFARRYPRPVILLQVGRHLETWSAEVRMPGCLPGAQLIDRAGLGAGLAWPLAFAARLRRRLRALGQPYVQINEDGWYKGGRLKRRALARVFPLALLPRATVATPFSTDINPGVAR